MHGWHLAITGEAAFHEYFEAWPYGPVNEKLYYIFKEFGNKPIIGYALTWKRDKQKVFVVSYKEIEFYGIFDMVIRKYMKYTPLELSSFTHAAGTPWHTTIREQGSGVISNTLIKDYFQSLVHKQKHNG